MTQPRVREIVLAGGPGKQLPPMTTSQAKPPVCAYQGRNWALGLVSASGIMGVAKGRAVAS